jgi:hypothetical protein
MTVLGKLIPDAGDVLIAELGRLAQAPATGPAMERALRKSPAPLDSLLEYLAGANADPDLILRLSRNLPARTPAKDRAAWQTKLIALLVARGDVDRAYQLWRTFSAARAPERKAGLYDSGLQGLPGFAPFNWYYPTTGAGVAERSRSGLEVEFYGRDDADLAGQLLMLPPGRYRFAFVAEGAADGESSKISWKVECLQSKLLLGELVLRKIDYSPRRMAGEFTIPPQGCSAQWLKLAGTATEFTKPQNATIRNIQLMAVR